MAGPLRLTDSPIFINYPWFTGLPVGDYDESMSLFHEGDDGWVSDYFFSEV